MKICFPVSQDKGFESKVYRHFGSAPLFIVVETKSNHVTTVNNGDMHHEHGKCNPRKALDNRKVDAMIVGGIGAGALSKLNKIGIKVFHARAVTVKENIELLKARNLNEFEIKDCCKGFEGVESACRHY
jgi:predicted Fe-Mo cluster-binding NifX family protein